MLDVKHFLNIYKVRKSMYEEGISHPLPEVKSFISELIKKLSLRNPDEKVELKRNKKNIYELRSKTGESIIMFPDFENLAKEKNIPKR